MDQQQEFFDSIRESIIAYCNKKNILSSIFAAFAAIMSNYGSSSVITNNLYNLSADSKWYGKCYSSDTKTIYNSVKECKEISPSLYRVYDSYKDSISDFIDTILSEYRGSNINHGPLKYYNLLANNTNYYNCVYSLSRAGMFEEYIHISEVVTNKEQFVIAIIEKYKLYDWDKSYMEEQLEMSKRRRKSSNSQSNNLIENPVNMYRVRLSWDNSESQIFASPILDDAIEEASKHEGYHVYDKEGNEVELTSIDTEENDVEDIPEVKRPPVEEPDTSKKIFPFTGKKINLNKTAVYKTAASTEPFAYATGEYYFYDHTIMNNRGKITANKNIAHEGRFKNIKMIYGYIDLNLGK